MYNYYYRRAHRKMYNIMKSKSKLIKMIFQTKITSDLKLKKKNVRFHV